jgi:hypothetical protein
MLSLLSPHIHMMMMMMMMIIMSMWWVYVCELQPQIGLLFVPQVIIWTWRTVVEWYRQCKTPDLSARALWQSDQQSNLVASRRNLAKEIVNLAFKITLSVLRSYFVHTVTSYSMGPKEGVLCALKNPSPRPGLNPQALGPMSSTLSITAPRRLSPDVNAGELEPSTKWLQISTRRDWRWLLAPEMLQQKKTSSRNL